VEPERECACGDKHSDMNMHVDGCQSCLDCHRRVSMSDRMQSGVATAKVDMHVGASTAM
jgi:hypothetical protein